MNVPEIERFDPEYDCKEGNITEEQLRAINEIADLADNLLLELQAMIDAQLSRIGVENVMGCYVQKGTI